MEFDCIGESVKSPIIASAKVNPNFPEPWAYFDLVSWKLLSLSLCEILLVKRGTLLKHPGYIILQSFESKFISLRCAFG